MPKKKKAPPSEQYIESDMDYDSEATTSSSVSRLSKSSKTARIRDESPGLTYSEMKKMVARYKTTNRGLMDHEEEQENKIYTLEQTVLSLKASLDRQQTYYTQQAEAKETTIERLKAKAASDSESEESQILKQMREEIELLKSRNTQLLDEMENLRQETKQAAETNKKRKKPNTSSDSDSESAPTPRQLPKKTALPEAGQAAHSKAAQAAEPRTTAPKIPPVVMHNKESWTEVSRQLASKGIKFTKAKTISQGIAITPETTEDYRRLTRTFNEDKREYHTYSLPEEKTLRVVVRGLPVGITAEQVKEDLQEQGFGPVSCHRMTAYRTKQPLPLFLVLAPKEDTALLDVSRCCHLVVRVEHQRRRKELSQCHRCQRFGHAQGRCTATPKCVKCGEDHHSATCTKTRETPAKCANCGGDHPANYRGCDKAPKKTRAPAAMEPQQQQRSPPTTPAAGNKHPSYARAVQPQQTGQPQPPQQPEATPSAQTLVQTLEVMREMMANMATMLAAFQQGK